MSRTPTLPRHSALTACAVALLTLGACLDDPDVDDPDVDDPTIETSVQALASGYQYMWNREATWSRRCLEVTGVVGARVTAEVCSSRREHQGLQHPSSGQLVGQTTGPGKCLATFGANQVIMQACAPATAVPPAQRWTVTSIAGTAFATFRSAVTGHCLTLRPGGVVITAACAGTDDQAWRRSLQATLIDAMQAGRLTQEMADPAALVGEIVVPASAATKAATEGGIQKWSLYPIFSSYPGNDYEELGAYAIGRDAWGVPRTFFKTVRTHHPSDRDDLRLELTALTQLGTYPRYERKTLVVDGAIATQTTSAFGDNLPISTANALLAEDITLSQAAGTTTLAGVTATLVRNDVALTTSPLGVGDPTPRAAGAWMVIVNLYRSVATSVALSGGINHAGPSRCRMQVASEAAGAAHRCAERYPLGCAQNPDSPQLWSCTIEQRDVRQGTPYLWPGPTQWRACSAPPTLTNDLSCAIAARKPNENGPDSCRWRCIQPYVTCGYRMCPSRL